MTHYQVLGVPFDAAVDEIKAAHRRLALERHPDKTSVSSSRSFQRIQKAWECLRDESLRREYDETLKQVSSKEAAAIPIRLSDMELGQDEYGAPCYAYSCRCGDEVAVWQEDIMKSREKSITVECRGCSFVYRVTDDVGR